MNSLRLNETHFRCILKNDKTKAEDSVKICVLYCTWISVKIPTLCFFFQLDGFRFLTEPSQISNLTVGSLYIEPKVMYYITYYYELRTILLHLTINQFSFQGNLFTVFKVSGYQILSAINFYFWDIKLFFRLSFFFLMLTPCGVIKIIFGDIIFLFRVVLEN